MIEFPVTPLVESNKIVDVVNLRQRCFHWKVLDVTDVTDVNVQVVPASSTSIGLPRSLVNKTCEPSHLGMIGEFRVLIAQLTKCSSLSSSLTVVTVNAIRSH